MGPASLAARPRRRSAAVLAAVAVVAAMWAPSAAANEVDIEDDPAVAAARARQSEAQALLGKRSTQLDAAVEAFERANAHHLRLTDELESADATVANAEQNVADAEAQFAKRVVGAYKRPTAAAALAAAVFSARDAATALHRAALVEQAAVGGVELLADVRHSSELTVDGVRQQQIVAAGAAWSSQARKVAADELTLAVGAARADAERSEQQLRSARADATRRAEQAQLALQRQRTAEQILAAGAGPLPPVEGKVCPIGAPNGFIDSWGFPRSGGRRHQGIDMFASYGTPLFAVADGTITKIGNGGLGGLSLHLVDERGDDYYYAHLSAVAVTVGQRVHAGDVVGANGNSGNAASTPPHLHWQYHPSGGEPVNPYPLALLLCR